MKKSNRLFAVITGGGTSGHVMPALAIAELLIDSGFSRDQIHLVGTVNGVETKLVPPTGVSLTLLDVRGFSRKLSLVALKTNLQTVIMLSRAINNATALLRSLKPAVVISVGGYGSVAAARAARKLKIPVITV